MLHKLQNHIVTVNTADLRLIAHTVKLLTLRMTYTLVSQNDNEASTVLATAMIWPLSVKKTSCTSLLLTLILSTFHLLMQLISSPLFQTLCLPVIVCQN